MRIYVAAPYARAHVVRCIHDDLIEAGHAPTSSWAIGADGPDTLASMTSETRRLCYLQNRRDIERAELLLALVYPGEGKEMFAEATVAMLTGKYVHWIGKEEHMPLSAFAPDGGPSRIYADFGAWFTAVTTNMRGLGL